MSEKHLSITIENDGRTLVVERDFAAGQEAVWDAWTTPDLLDRWWAPKPYQARTKSMELREGGTWLYAMTGPEGDTHYGSNTYTAIDAPRSFSSVDAFCDENGKINDGLPRATWSTTFEKQGEGTRVTVRSTYDDAEDLNIEMGMKEGFTMALQNLDEVLAE
jgi:uncharacterized protein YndB with AHSA1/START domain